MIPNVTVLREIKLWKKPWHLARQILAKSYLSLYPNVEIIGITGSVGKTTTKEAIYSILSQKYPTLASRANIDPVVNIPETILKLKPDIKKMVLELGVEYPGEMDFYLSLISPKVGVLTRIYWTHTQFFGDIAGVFAQKSKLIYALPADGWAILNWDDPLQRQLALKIKAQIIWYGTNGIKCQVFAEDFQQNTAGSKIIIGYKNERVDVNWRLIGEHNMTNALAACAVGISQGLSLVFIKKGLEQVAPQPGRLNILSGPNSSILIDDTYNANPIASIEAIKTARAITGDGKLVVVLADMKELGQYSKRGHEEVAKAAIEQKVDVLFTIGQEAEIAHQTAKSQITAHHYPIYVKDIAQKIAQEAKEDTVILVKGSRHAHLERIVLLLEGKSSLIHCFHCGRLE